MNGQLFALLTSDVNEISLAVLGRAVTRARRCDGILIRRAFVRSQGGTFVSAGRTARFRVRWE